MTVFLGILFSSIREIEVPYVFDLEHGTPQHEMQGNQASTFSRGKSHGFSRVAAGTWGTFSSYDRGAHSKREFV